MKKAFSLFEMAMVIVVIALVLSAIAQTDKFILYSSINSAQSLTKSSPVHSISGLVAWYETSLDESFINSEAKINGAISTWYDINLKSSTSHNATATSTAKPTYIINNQARLPILKFNGTSNALNLPDATVPYGNSSYSIFFVSKAYTLHNGGILGSGLSSNNSSNSFRYASDGTLLNYWWSADVSASSYTAGRLYVLSFIYDNSVTGNRKIYINGVSSAGTDGASAAHGGRTNFNTIGVTNGSELLNGEIGEIIIFERALDTNERTAVQNYLAKKWSVKVS